MKSTGPKSAEGKATSRLNALRHGLAGESDLLGPGEDPALVARRGAAFATELGATCALGRMLAGHAALMSIRVERSAERELVAIAADSARAREEFDQTRFDALDRLIADLDEINPEAALAELEEAPEGVEHLATAWAELRDQLRSADRSLAEQARTRALAWLGVGLDPGTDAELAGQAEAEGARLRLKSRSPEVEVAARAVDRARHEAGLLATFNPSREATLARRYEAAASRAMYRALREIADLRRARGVNLAAAPVRPSAACTPPIPAPTPLLPPPPAVESSCPTPPSLGSFRAGPPVAPFAAARPVLDPSELPNSRDKSRPRRPDLREWAGGRH